MKVKTAIILAGGKAKRLKKRLDGKPKILSQIANKTFLDYQINWLAQNHYNQIYILGKYKSELIKKHLKTNYKNFKIKIFIIKEREYLGTGGAIKNFLKQNKIDVPFTVLNGDTFFKSNILNFYKKINNSNKKLLLAISKVENTNRYGEIKFIKDIFLKISKNKNKLKEGYVYAGIMIFNNLDILNFKKKIFQLEDFLNWFNKKNNIYVYKFKKNFFYDIGTVESYDKIKKNGF